MLPAEVAALIWEVASYGHQYTTSALSLYATLLATVLGLVALSMAVLPTAGPRHELPLEGLIPLALLLLLINSGLVIAPIWSWVKSPGGIFSTGDASPAAAFRPLLTREVGIGAATGWLVFGAVIALYRRRISVGHARLTVVVAMLAMIPAAAGPVHATLLIRSHCLPRIELVGHTFLHVGRAREVAVRTTCSSSFGTPDAQEVTAEAAGVESLHFAMSAPLFSAARDIRLTAGQESGIEEFDVREGNRWLYELEEISQVTSAGGERTMHEFHQDIRVGVGTSHLEHGLRVFPLTVQYGEDMPTSVDVVGWEGTLRRLHDRQLEDFIASPPEGEPLEGFLLPGRCRGVLDGGGPRSPSLCKVKVGMGAGMSAALLRILSVGAATYIPPRERYHLREAEWGPVGGEEIPRRTPVLPEPQSPSSTPSSASPSSSASPPSDAGGAAPPSR